MFRLFSKSPRPVQHRSRRTILRLEGLEWRDQPSAVAGGYELTGGGLTLTNSTPQITSFYATDCGRGVYEFSGTVAAPGLSNVRVALIGVPSVAGVSIPVNSGGTFSTIVVLQTNGSDAGMVSAVVTDTQGLPSAPATAEIEGSAAPSPTINNFTAVNHGNDMYSFSGYVSDASPANVEVVLSGVPDVEGMAAWVNPAGSFSVSVQLMNDGSDVGIVSAVATAYNSGLNSEPATVNVSPSTAPILTNFTAVNTGNNLFQFSGNVVASSLTNLQVQLAGVPSVKGTSIPVNSDGTFSTTVQLQSDGSDIGTVTGQVMNDQGDAITALASAPVVPISTPVIESLTATNLGNDVYSLSGTVSQTAGLTTVQVQFGGSQSTQGVVANVQPNGSFSTVVQLQGNGIDTVVYAEVIDDQGSYSNLAVVPVAPTKVGPQILTFTVTKAGNGLFTLSGTVNAADAIGTEIAFSGIASTENLTTTVNSGGTFSITIPFATDGTDSGAITAQAIDINGATSATQTVAAVLPPVITEFLDEECGNGEFVFEGEVTAANPAGLIVTFSGVPTMNGLKAVVQSNGSFMIGETLKLNGSDTGMVAVTVTNANGTLVSNTMMTLVIPTA